MLIIVRFAIAVLRVLKITLFESISHTPSQPQWLAWTELMTEPRQSASRLLRLRQTASAQSAVLQHRWQNTAATPRDGRWAGATPTQRRRHNGERPAVHEHSSSSSSRTR